MRGAAVPTTVIVAWLLILVSLSAVCSVRARGPSSDAFNRPFFINKSNAIQLAASEAATALPLESTTDRALGCECLRQWNYTVLPHGEPPNAPVKILRFILCSPNRSSYTVGACGGLAKG